MNKRIPKIRATTLQDLFNWSISLPEWQRHGLRSIVTETLTDEEFAEILELCRLEHGLPFGRSTAVPARVGKEPPVAVPLAAQDLPRGEEITAPVTLIKVEGVRSVDALAGDQTLSFEVSGLTVVYGDNASGKSGYARILKRVCRARDRGGKLIPNAFEDAPEEETQPKATIHFRVGDVEKTLEWAEGEPTAPELPFVQVFDSRCALVQVTDKNDVVFTPYVLEILQQLGELCSRVKQQLQSERTIEEARASNELSRKIDDLGRQTEAGSGLASLKHDSDLAALRRLGTLSAEESERLTWLQEVLSQNSAKAATESRQRKREFTQVLQLVEAVAKGVSAHRIAALEEALRDAATKTEAARLAASNLFAEQPLEGVGSSPWRELWKAARRFSLEKAYPDSEFPVVGKEALCVLCQQPLAVDAQERLEAFESFVRANTEQEAQTARQRFEQEKRKLEELKMPSSSRRLVQPVGEQLSDSVRRFVVCARLKRRAALRACEGRGSFPTEDIGTGPVADLQKRTPKLDARIKEIEKSAQTEVRAVHESEKAELEARRELGKFLPVVEDEVQHLNRLFRIDRAVKSAGTTKVSRKSSKMAESEVTNRLREQFFKELVELRVRTAQVELAPTGSRQGTPQFRAQFVAQPDVKLRRVLSEGEQTCVALAGFLAELAVAQHRSALVFDDPVSSLDHRWRKQVARRLRKESEQRQVIVFTHDNVFLSQLTEGDSSASKPVSVVHLERGSQGFGVVVDGASWDGMRVSARVKLLEHRVRELRPAWESGDESAYREGVERVYKLLRNSWERGIEERLLNGVVQRFRRGVETQRLKRLTDITEDDVKEISEAMAKCSLYVHDEAGPLQEETPDFENDVQKDVKRFKDWIESMSRRKRTG